MYTFAVCICALVGLGIGLVARLPAPLPFYLTTAGVAGTGALLALGRRGDAKRLFLCATLAAAAWRSGDAVPGVAGTGLNATGERDITCLVATDPEQSGLYRQFTCRITAVDGASFLPVANVYLTAPSEPAVEFGDTVAFSAELEAPRESEEAPGWATRLRLRGIGSTAYSNNLTLVQPGAWSLQRQLYSLRRAGLASLRRAMPSPESAFAGGVVLGSAEGMPDSIEDDLRRSGLLHILVVSGYNVTMVAAFAVGPLRRRLGWRATFWCAATLGGAYALLTGADPPVLRALAMLLLVLGARVVGRPGNSVACLCVAATGMAVISPVLLLDASYQLSVAATAGLVWAQSLPFLRKLRGGAPAYLAEALVGSAAAMAMTLPLLAAHMGTIPLLGLLANVVAQPLQGLLFAAACFGTAAAATLPAAFATWLCAPATLTCRAILALARTTAGLPLAAVDTSRWSAAGVALYYATLIAAVNAVSGGEVRRLVRAALGGLRTVGWGVVAFGTTAAASALALAIALDMPDGRLHVAFLDVGQGDAILITSPHGHTMLVDGGRDPDVLLAHLGRALPFWRRSLDVVAATHPDMDHIGGLLELPRRYRTGALLSPGMTVPGQWQALWQDVQAAADSVTEVAQGDRVTFPDGVAVQVLSPAQGCSNRGGSDNDCSLVLRLTYGHASVLLTGDAEKRTETALLAAMEPALVLKVGHHGSAGCSSAAFLAAVAPRVAVISVGDNNYGHPAAETMKRLQEQGSRILRTDESGTIELVTDGSVYITREG